MQTSVENMPSRRQLYSEGHFDDFIRYYVHVDCGSLPSDFAEQTRGPLFRIKTTLKRFARSGRTETLVFPSLTFTFQIPERPIRSFNLPMC
jgi:hypothetical protein